MNFDPKMPGIPTIKEKSLLDSGRYSAKIVDVVGSKGKNECYYLRVTFEVPNKDKPVHVHENFMMAHKNSTVVYYGKRNLCLLIANVNKTLAHADRSHRVYNKDTLLEEDVISFLKNKIVDIVVTHRPDAMYQSINKIVAYKPYDGFVYFKNKIVPGLQ